MTTIDIADSPTLDFTAAARWPVRAAAHVLGAGLLTAVVIALPTAPSDLDRHQLPKELAVHLATFLAVALARPWPARGLRPAIAWSAALLVVAALVSSLLATNIWLAVRAWSLLITGIAALITARHLASLGEAPTLLRWCCAAGIAGAATGLSQAYGLDSPLFAVTRLPGGTFGNRNFMAHFAALSLPVIAYLTFSARRRWIWVVGTIGAAALVTAIVLTRSRAAWIGCVAGAMIFGAAWYLGRRRQPFALDRRRPVLLALMMTTGLVVAMLVPNRLSWRSASPYSDTLTGLANHDDGSGHGRVLQYRNTLRLAMRHPALGVGPGNWPIRYSEVAPANDPSWVYGDVVPLNPWPSSDWMALVSEGGVIGLVLALLLGCALAWRGVRAVRAGGESAIAGAALLSLLAVAFVEGNFDAVLLLPAPLLLVALATGALLEQSDGAATPPSGDGAKHGRVASLMALLLGLITLRSALQTSAYLIAGNGRSTARLTWAARVDPGSYPIRIALAQRSNCDEGRNDVIAVMRLAPGWPASLAAARRCGIRMR